MSAQTHQINSDKSPWYLGIKSDTKINSDKGNLLGSACLELNRAQQSIRTTGLLSQFGHLGFEPGCPNNSDNSDIAFKSDSRGNSGTAHDSDKSSFNSDWQFNSNFVCIRAPRMIRTTGHKRLIRTTVPPLGAYARRAWQRLSTYVCSSWACSFYVLFRRCLHRVQVQCIISSGPARNLSKNNIF